MEDEFFVAYLSAIEKRLQEQIARTRSVSPNATTKRIKEIQLVQEIERINTINDYEVRIGLTAYVNDLFKKL